MPASVALHLGDDAPDSSSWIVHVPHSAGGQMDVSLIDGLPSRIATDRAQLFYDTTRVRGHQFAFKGTTWSTTIMSLFLAAVRDT